MHRNFKTEAGLFDLAGSSDPASLGPPLGEPLSIGDLAAVIVSDAGAMRKGAPPYQWKAEQIQHPIRAASRRSR